MGDVREQAGRARASVVRGGWARRAGASFQDYRAGALDDQSWRRRLDAAPLPTGRIRRKGGGRHALGDKDTGLRAALRRLVDPDTFGDPMRPLVWVSKSLEKLATALTSMGFPVGIDTVRTELRKLGFSRQGNRKAEEGSNHADRDAQFQYINATVLAAQGRGAPVVSVDTKKKELIGNFKNAGTDYRPKRDPLRVNVHDLEDKSSAKSLLTASTT